ncbi:MAG: hypothetical protein QOI66_753, partial [Myxococcales bacterium]|nr:hypothetical protein [Myxococcales bacterium]
MTTTNQSLRSIACAIGFLSGALVLAPGCGDAVDHRPAAWEYISPAIIQPNCATTSCHSRAAAVAGLDFSTPDHGYTSLTALWVWIVDPNGTPENGCRPYGDEFVCQRNHRPLVTAFDPAQSRLVHMLRAEGTARMPPDRPLPQADIALIEHWILNGARKSLGDTGRDAASPLDGAGDGATGDGMTAGDGSSSNNEAGDGGQR